MKILLTSIVFLCITAVTLNSQIKKDLNGIYLIVRADDLASSQAANEAIIKTYKEGIARSTEIMVPSPWFIEATKLLKENPGLDAGVHLVLTSEWENVKWRPLTYAPSLVDSNGYFFPMVWKNKDFPPHTSIMESNWKAEEIERELEAQIVTAKKHIPQLSHISDHMGFSGLDSQIRRITMKLAKEYNLEYETSDYDVNYFNGFDGSKTQSDKITTFINNLKNLKPGVYLFVEHPSVDTPEMRHTGHKGYYSVASERQFVTALYTNKEVLNIIKEKNIHLISYADLAKLK